MIFGVRRGFTLVELLVVISIIGLLASILTASTQRAKERAVNSARMQNKDTVIHALNAYYLDKGHYPFTGGEWFCIGPSSYVCYNDSHNGNDALAAELKPYLGGFPINNAVPGTLAHNSLKYYGGPAGSRGDDAWLLWISSNKITTYDCPNPLNDEPPSEIIPLGDYDPYYWYCWQDLGN